MTLQWPDKDPDAVLDYQIDWSRWLAGDTIAISEWIVPSGIVKVSDLKTVSTVTIWLSGGVTGTTYELTNRIQTTGGRMQDQTVLLSMQDE